MHLSREPLLDFLEETYGKIRIMVDAAFVSERIMLTGKALRWQQDSRELSYFGSLLDNIEHNSENDLLTDRREGSDKQYLERIRKDFSKAR